METKPQHSVNQNLHTVHALPKPQYLYHNIDLKQTTSPLNKSTISTIFTAISNHKPIHKVSIRPKAMFDIYGTTYCKSVQTNLSKQQDLHG